jgi:hypothetical protein
MGQNRAGGHRGLEATGGGMNTKEKIAVMEAFLDGKRIQFKFGAADWLDWNSEHEPDWAWHRVDYRIKPEPREWTLGLNRNGTFWSIDEESRRAGVEYIKVREVL